MRTSPLHVGSLMVFEGPVPALEEVQRVFAARLHLVPRYRQKVRTVPLHLSTPVWVDDRTSPSTTTSATPRCPSPAMLTNCGGSWRG